MKSDCQYVKGSTPIPARFAEGGEVLHKTNSRFIKTEDTFRTDIQDTDYKKEGKGKMGDDKSLPPVKPHT